MGLVVTAEAIRKCVGPEWDVTKRWLHRGYRVEGPGGMTFFVSQGEVRNARAGGPPEIYAAMVRVIRDVLGSESMTWTPGSNADMTEFMALAMHAQALGMKVRIGQSSSPFATKLPPIPPMGNSHGNAGIATRAMLAAGGLTGGAIGRGLRLGEDDAGNIIRYAGPSSVALIGASRKGKFATICGTMTVEAIGNRSLVLLDPKGELLATTKRACEGRSDMRVLCPLKEGLPTELARFADQTDSYNPLDLLDPKSESFVKDCDTLSEIIVAPDTSGEGTNSGFFSESAQGTVSGVMMQLKLNYPQEADLANLASIICSERLFSFAATAMKTGDQYVTDRLSTFGAPDAPLMKGGINDILRELRRQIKWLSDPAIARIFRTPAKPWRFDDLKRGAKPTTVYVVLPAKYMASSRRCFRLLLGAAVLELQSTPPGRWPVTCVADEFAMLGRVPIFETVFAEGAGHGFNMVPIIQNAGQMITAYGREGFRNLLSGCEVQIFLGPRDIQTAEEISKLAGRRTIITSNASHADTGKGSVSFDQMGQNVLDPHAVMALPNDQMVMFAPGLVKDVIIARRRGYWEYPEIAALCDDNPYYRPAEPAASDTTPETLFEEQRDVE